MFGSLNNFQQRFLLGFLGIVLISAIIVLSHTPPFHYLFIASVAAIQALALWEYCALAAKKTVGTKACIPQKNMAICFSLIWIVLHYCYPCQEVLALSLFAFLTATFAGLLKESANAIINSATTLFGLVYITIPLTFLIDLNFSGSITTSSSIWIVYLITTTKMTDTCAYFAGKSIGNHLLAPVLSPKKTWEGAIFGLIGACATSVAFFSIASMQGYSEITSFSLTQSALLGLAIGLFAQLGDLAESLLKRDADVKDSNNLPGFGGFLDIVDSLIFTAPLLFFWLKIKNVL